MSEEIVRALSQPEGSGEGGSDRTKPSQPTSQSSADSLEGLLSTLKSQMKDSDWLKENTAERWEKENPEVAAEFKKKRAEGNKTSASNS